MISTVLHEILKAVEVYYGHEKNVHHCIHAKVHHCIHAMGQMTCIFVHPTFLIGLNTVIKVFKEVIFGDLKSLNPFGNTLFFCCFVVKKGNISEDWLTVKASSMKNSGMGVFASQFFKKNKFAPCYYGIYNEHPSNDTYTFKKINTMPNTFILALNKKKGSLTELNMGVVIWLMSM
jgi:hypothetical protein